MFIKMLIKYSIKVKLKILNKLFIIFFYRIENKSNMIIMEF